MAAETQGTAEERAEKRVEDFTAMAWHIATYVIINVFLWIIVPSAAVWVTFFWGIGLAFHAAYYLIGDDGRDNRRYKKYLEEERASDTQDSAPI